MTKEFTEKYEGLASIINDLELDMKMEKEVMKIIEVIANTVIDNYEPQELSDFKNACFYSLKCKKLSFELGWNLFNLTFGEEKKLTKFEQIMLTVEKKAAKAFYNGIYEQLDIVGIINTFFKDIEKIILENKKNSKTFR